MKCQDLFSKKNKKKNTYIHLKVSSAAVVIAALKVNCSFVKQNKGNTWKSKFDRVVILV